jgi:TonB family protein
MPSVRPGAQTALNAARSPFATYVARIHDRLHQTYHDFVQNLPLDATGPFGDPNLRTLLEIVLNRDGSVHRVGVVRSSGLSMFDYGAYNAVMRGQPYPVAPDEILSGDGRIYMHWDFHRQQPYCHQSHARPYILPNIGGAREDEPPVQQLQDTAVVPSDARVTFGVERPGRGRRGAGRRGAGRHDEEGEDGHDHDSDADGRRRRRCRAPARAQPRAAPLTEAPRAGRSLPAPPRAHTAGPQSSASRAWASPARASSKKRASACALGSVRGITTA